MKTQRKPSVTELIGQLDKPALLGWANRIGLEGKSLVEARRQNMTQGASLHKHLERWLLNGTPMPDEDFQAKAKAFFGDKNVLACEKSIDHEKFTGRLDIKYETEDGTVWICDFKTNQSRLYRENKLQLAAYRMVEGCDRVAVISIPDMKIIEADIFDFEPYEEMILHLAEIYQLSGIIEKPYRKP
jgi:hypothetical protein